MDREGISRRLPALAQGPNSAGRLVALSFCDPIPVFGKELVRPEHDHRMSDHDILRRQPRYEMLERY
ncbi:MAG: hypothetical protein AAB368_09405, partial [bacterium]